jgi:hypothetical protein
MKKNLFVFLFLVTGMSSCSFFGEKNKVSDYIDRPDYSLKSVEYVPVLPNFGKGITPLSLYFGYDELLYAVDSSRGIVSYDAAGNELGRLNLPGLNFVIQNRSLDLYALGKFDSVLNGQAVSFPVVYKISQKVSAEGQANRRLDLNAALIVKKLKYPFDFITISSASSVLADQLNKVNFTSLGFLDNNAYYLVSNGPEGKGASGGIYNNNSILLVNTQDRITDADGNVNKPFGLTTLVQPPQRARMESKKDFLYTSIDSNLTLKVQYKEVLKDADENEFFSFKALPIPLGGIEADGYLYQPFRFTKPVSVLYTGTSQRYIFVADEAKDSIFVFQSNGFEGTSPPPQYTNRKMLKVSFGGKGSGPLQFNRPKSIAFFNRTLYVADAGNKRIARFRLTSDYD